MSEARPGLEAHSGGCRRSCNEGRWTEGFRRLAPSTRPTHDPPQAFSPRQLDLHFESKKQCSEATQLDSVSFLPRSWIPNVSRVAVEKGWAQQRSGRWRGNGHGYPAARRLEHLSARPAERVIEMTSVGAKCWISVQWFCGRPGVWAFRRSAAFSPAGAARPLGHSPPGWNSSRFEGLAVAAALSKSHSKTRRPLAFCRPLAA